jgi:hypothetical protein
MNTSLLLVELIGEGVVFSLIGGAVSHVWSMNSGEARASAMIPRILVSQRLERGSKLTSAPVVLIVA